VPLAASKPPSRAGARQYGKNIVARRCFLLLFGVILFGFRRLPEPPGYGLRFGALIAFLVSLVSLFMQIVPVGTVADRTRYGVKVGVLILITLVVGAIIYRRGFRRRQSP
jgi:hypothetical protein